MYDKRLLHEELIFLWLTLLCFGFVCPVFVWVGLWGPVDLTGTEAGADPLLPGEAETAPVA